MTIYELDKQRVYTGVSRELGPKDPIPRNWTHLAPPETDDYAVFDGVKWFTRAEYPRPVQPTPEAPQRHITVGAFYDRFGEHKYPILSSTDPGVQALIADCAVRQYIDLDHEGLADGLQMVVDAGFAIDVDAVLSAPVEDGERP